MSSGCDVCVGRDPAQCFNSQEQVDFVKYQDCLESALTTETKEHLLCYFHRRPQWDTSGCATQPMPGVVTGTIDHYDDGLPAAPTVFQCYELLKATWPYLTHWFGHFFPTFQGPAATDAEKLAIKSTIYLWILRLGASSVNSEDWADLKTALKAAPAEWVNYLGWLGDTPGFFTNQSSLRRPSQLASSTTSRVRVAAVE